MIPKQREAEIIRLFHVEHWPIGTIARQLGVHHQAVRRTLRQGGVWPRAGGKLRPSKLDPYLPFILEQLERYPTLHASRLFTMVRDRGYEGGPDHFRSFIARHRPKQSKEAYLRLRTLIGEEGQVDWADFGKFTVGQASRPLVAFVMTLSWSRHLFVQFYPSMTMPWFLRGHVEAFEFFTGVPRRLLYDNLKSAVVERVGDAIRFNDNLLALAAHYRFEPRPVAVARGNEKGRVERAIRYIRENFFAARPWTDLADLNRQARLWCTEDAGNRPAPEDRTQRVRDLFEQERTKLLALPQDNFPCDERLDVEIGKTPYARFDLNDYSVPSIYVGTTLPVSATPDRVRVFNALGTITIADHPRSWDRGQQVEEAEHIQRLVDDKRRAREHRGLDRVHHTLQHGTRLLELIASRRGNVGSATARLLKLMTLYSAADIDAAIAEAIKRDTPHVGAVVQALDRARADRRKPPPVTVPIPERVRAHGLALKPHDLATYDGLRPKDQADE